MLAICGKVPLWKEIVLEFQKLTESGVTPPVAVEPGHRDGWGMAGADNDQTGMFEIARHVEAADLSPAFQETLKSLKQQPAVFMCHLRKASPGVPITIENVHPFFHSGWAFSHNGSIHDPQKLPRDQSFRLTSRGSDSEYLFQFLLPFFTNQPAKEKLLESVSEVISSLETRYTALNCILSNGRELFVIRDYSQFPDYYTLYYNRVPQGMIICSEPLDSEVLDRNNWQKIPNRSLLRINGTTSDIESFCRKPH
jgi:glutamine amidotransferase